jgi:hypothetical protein
VRNRRPVPDVLTVWGERVVTKPARPNSLPKTLTKEEADDLEQWKLKWDNTPLARIKQSYIREGMVETGLYRNNLAFTFSNLPQMERIVMAKGLEDTGKLIALATDEARDAKDVLQTLMNEVHALQDVVTPALVELVRDVRSSRMTVVSEIRDTLVALRDLRKFFLESDYTVEVERLERFVKLCRDLQEMKASGVFDAVCDSALNLAIQEKSKP